MEMGHESRDGVVGVVERCWSDFDVGCGFGMWSWVTGFGFGGSRGREGWLAERPCASGLSGLEVHVVS